MPIVFTEYKFKNEETTDKVKITKCRYQFLRKGNVVLQIILGYRRLLSAVLKYHPF